MNKVMKIMWMKINLEQRRDKIGYRENWQHSVMQASRAYEAVPIQITKEVNKKNYQAIMLMISLKKNNWRKAKRADKMKIRKAKKKRNRKKENLALKRRAKIVLYKCDNRLIKSKVHLNKVRPTIHQMMITNPMKMSRQNLWWNHNQCSINSFIKSQVMAISPKNLTHHIQKLINSKMEK